MEVNFLDTNSFFYISISIVFFSIVCSLLLSIMLSKKQTNYAMIMTSIVLSESMVIYSQFIIIILMKYNDEINSYYCETLIFLLFHRSS